jgi:DNA-binding Xre family transcriptional regulator
MIRHVTMQWRLRQVMADRGIFQTSELLPLLQERGVQVSREHVYRLVTRTPQRINIDILAALCDALGCGADELLTLAVEVPALGAFTRVDLAFPFGSQQLADGYSCW